MGILTPATPEEQKKEVLLVTAMKCATGLSLLDKESTPSECLRALAVTMENMVRRGANLCTHGCDITLRCEHLIDGSDCKLKSIKCERSLLHPEEKPDEGSSN